MIRGIVLVATVCILTIALASCDLVCGKCALEGTWSIVYDTGIGSCRLDYFETTGAFPVFYIYHGTGELDGMQFDTLSASRGCGESHCVIWFRTGGDYFGGDFIQFSGELSGDVISGSYYSQAAYASFGSGSFIATRE
jgi:hypothetical protein